MEASESFRFVRHVSADRLNDLQMFFVHGPRIPNKSATGGRLAVSPLHGCALTHIGSQLEFLGLELGSAAIAGAP
jgi:hypothetical protein